MDTSLITKRFNEHDGQEIRRAFQFAEKAHGDQRRLSGELYITHPFAVAQVLHDLGLDPSTIIAGLLHDTVEDTPVTREDIVKNFGEDIAFLVSAVTKMKTFEQKDAHATSYQTLMRMFFAMADDIRVILIKLADRYHNLQTLEHMPIERQKEIALKSISMYAPIAERLNIGELKGKIEDMAFPYAYPDKYAELIKQSQSYFEERKAYTQSIKPLIEQYLREQKIPIVGVDCRVKHYYSLYKKLLRKNNDINLIHDLVAFRIIVPDIERCYQTLGLIHQKYHPMPKLIKDYIALPKPNGYRSLHTTVFCEDGQLVEFQVRTQAMHEQAERGVAAHWAYGESGKQKGHHADTRELDWVNKIREWRNYIDNPEEFYEHLKLDIFKQRIFAFTPKGDIKDLPIGATPIDFAYAIHSDIGHHCVGAKVNGKMVSLKYKLRNGDLCEIQTSKKQMPHSDWLAIAQTSEARRHIKNALKT